MNPDEELDHWLTEAWSEHHGYLVNLAFRMLGDIGESEDVVQEASPACCERAVTSSRTSAAGSSS